MKSKNFTGPGSRAYKKAPYSDGTDQSLMSEIPGDKEINQSYLAFETLLDNPDYIPPTGSQRVVRGTVLATNHSDFTVAVVGHKVDAILPAAQAGDLKVGDTAEFLVTEDGGDSGENPAVLSYTQQLTWAKLTELAASGAICKVEVESVSKRRGSGRPGGLNVSFGGMKGFIPYSFVADSGLFSYTGPDDLDLDWEPTYIDVIVVKAEHGALVFSQKGTTKQAATAFINGLTVGDTIHGLVTSIYRGDRPGAHAGEDFEIGAFVEITPGVSGLVHKSDLAGYGSVESILPVGSHVMVQVIAADSSTRRVALSYTKVEANRQALNGLAVASRRAKIAELIIGQTMLGTVKVMLQKQSTANPAQKRCNAAIVTLPNGVDALLHYNDCMDGQMDDIRGLFKTGDEISVFIKATDLEKGSVNLGYN